jgi:hypothetical protein
VARETLDGFRAYVELVDSRRWYGRTPEEIRAAVPSKSAQVLFVADDVCLDATEFPVLVIDLFEDRQPFRCVVTELWGVDNNLNLANMDWETFAESVDDEGVFRGFTT